MLRYKGFISCLIKVAVITGLVMGTKFLGEEYELSLPTQLAKLQLYRDNKIITANNEVSIGRYRDNTEKLKQIHTDIKKTTSITLDNRDNFLGYVGQTINQYKLNIKRITYVDIDNYVNDYIANKPQDTVDEKFKEYDPEIKANILKDTIGYGVDPKAKNKAKGSFNQPKDSKPLIDNSKMNAILIDVSGDTNLYNFMLDLEKYNYRYLVSGLDTDKENSTVRLIIDLR